MRIKKLQIKDYKRFYDLTIDLVYTPSRIIALVGPNGCGKSSVFDSMLYHLNAYGHIGDTGSKDYKYHSSKEDPSFDYQKVNIQFENGNFSTI